ncbi:unnamed protein product [Bursaphelenchus xylophilus]|uniref:(pine wood nematode) hypothetical protein n=1 Tax=Bursaphelenchus xylophilus TaxID=6326 RepID=A0A1I7S1Y6_BURXY|nr:unnamed protein product [Bursaphelenchus xylophilus]CAG9090117.1 unnamed protein product [Bursaphelenchus xylophilus]
MYQKNAFHRIPLTSFTESELKKLDVKERGKSIEIWPSFQFRDDANGLDVIKSRRQLYYVASELNSSLSWRWWGSFLHTISLPKIGAYVSQELGFEGFVKELFRHSDVELLVGKFENYHQFLGLYFYILTCIFALLNLHLIDNKLFLIPCTRLVICIYGVGDKIPFDPQIPGLLQENAFFVVWSIFVGTLQCALDIWDAIFRWSQRQENQIYRSILNIGYTVFMTASILHIIALLSYVVLPKSHQLHPTYLLMLTADSLRIIMLYIQHSCRVYSEQNPTFALPQWAPKLGLICANFFEIIFISTAIQHGMFVRDRLFAITLVPYNVENIKRFFALIWDIV